MDSHVAWFRQRIIGHVALELALGWAVMATAAAAALLLAGSTDATGAVVAAAVIATVATAGRFVAALFTNPLDIRYVRALLAEAVEVDTPDRSPLLDDGPRDEAVHRFDLVDHTADAAVCSVYSAGSNIISRSAVTDAVVLYSQLADGRRVVTDAQLTVPREGWITNLHRGGDLRSAAQSHEALLAELSSRGTPVDPTPDPAVVLDHLDAEREGLRQLGLPWACFVAVGGRRSRFELSVDVEAGPLLGLHGLDSTGDERHRRVLAIETPARTSDIERRARPVAH